MKYLYCYLGKYIEWETLKDRSLETYRYCDLTNLVRNIPRVKISEVNFISPIGDFRPGEMFWVDDIGSDGRETFSLNFSEYGNILTGLKVYSDMVFKSTGRFDKWQISNDCVKVLEEYIREKTRDLRIDLILD